MTEETITICLPEAASSDERAALLEDLKKHQGHTVEINCSALPQFTSLEAQLLAAAKLQWEASGHLFTLTGLNDSLKSDLGSLGLSTHLMN